MIGERLKNSEPGRESARELWKRVKSVENDNTRFVDDRRRRVYEFRAILMEIMRTDYLLLSPRFVDLTDRLVEGDENTKVAIQSCASE